MAIPKISVFNYDNYRSYLADKFAELQRIKRKFTYREFSRQAGFASPNILRLVIDSERNLSRDSALRFSEVLGHNKGEHAFFEDLIFFNQSQTTEEKNHYFQRLWAYPKSTLVQKLEKKQFKIFNHWYVSVICQMVDLKDFTPDPDWIADRIFPGISRVEAQQALDLLMEVGMIEFQDGKYIKKEASFFTGKEVRSVYVRMHHQQMIELGKASIDTVVPDEREIGAVTMSVRKDQIAGVKERIANFRRELVESITGEGSAEVVYQLNFQFFPVVTLPDIPKAPKIADEGEA